MSKVYAVSMNKGGVGKTSLVTNLSAAISVKNPDKRVLIIDMDGQGNASLSFGHRPAEFETTVYDVMTGTAAITDAIIKLMDNLDILPANDDMNYLEFDVLTNPEKYPERFSLLTNAIESIRTKYDYIFVDSPPSLGLIAGNILAAADHVIIPFVPETFAVQGLIRVLESVEEFKRSMNPKLNVAGIVGMMVDTRTTLHSEMLQKARQYCEGKQRTMYTATIPRSIRFANATAYDSKPAVLTADKNSAMVAAYFDLAEEVFAVG